MSEQRFKRYPTYKDSGVGCLGEIPAHWEVKRLKYVAPVRNSKLEAKPDDMCYVGLENVVPWTGNLLLDTQPESVESVVGTFRAGDVLFGKLRPYLAKAASPDFDGVCTTEILALSPTSGWLQRYLMYFLLNAPYVRWIDALTFGAKMPRLSAEQITSSYVSAPPEREQRAIAAFLDRETARIDSLVAKKERLIDLLQEKRTAFITSAVTKGFDPSVPMKDSGVEWIGEIPAHWEISPLKARYDVELGKMLDSKRITGEHLRPYLRNVDVQWDQVSTVDLPEMDFTGSDRERYALRPGDLLVCEGGEVGRTAVWRGELPECYYQKALHRIRPRLDGDSPRFLFYDMRMLVVGKVFASTGNQNTIDHLTSIQLKHHRFAFPPAHEQATIATHLDRETAGIDSLVAKISEGIERLKEYRTALISAVVIGKIDVRGIVA